MSALSPGNKFYLNKFREGQKTKLAHPNGPKMPSSATLDADKQKTGLIMAATNRALIGASAPECVRAGGLCVCVCDQDGGGENYSRWHS